MAASVLLVNDIPDHQYPYEAALRSSGHDVVVATSAADALVQARILVPDCAVIDIRLPDMNGWELCSLFKNDAALRMMRIVMLAQDVSKEVAEEGRRRACTAWLARPTVADDLARTVDHVLAQERSEPTTHEEAMIGISECPACESEQIRAGVGVGPVQYYCCRGCGLCWRVEVNGEATA